MASEFYPIMAIEKSPVYHAEPRCGGLLEQEGWYMIRSLKDQGLSISEITRRLGISRTTVRRYLKSGKVPQYRRDVAGSKIESHLPLISYLINRHNLTSVRIYEELRKKVSKDQIVMMK